MALWLRDAFMPLVTSLSLHLVIIYFATLAWSGQSLWHDQRPSDTLPLSARLLPLLPQTADSVGASATSGTAPNLSVPSPEVAPLAALPTLPSLPELGTTPGDLPPATTPSLEEAAAAAAVSMPPRYRNDLLREALLAEERQQRHGKQFGGGASGKLAEVVAYRDAIALTIERSWRPPPSVAVGIELELLIRLSPAGEVLAVSVTRSSGDAVFDASARAAVRRVGNFALLQQLPRPLFEQYFRRFRLLFRPQVERVR